jgi:membrane glycosyltransferase
VGEDSAPVDEYLSRLPLDAGRRAALRAAAAGARNTREAMEAVHRALAGTAPASAWPAFDSLPARLALALNGEARIEPRPSDTDVQGHARLVTTPRFNRASMSPRRWFGRPGMGLDPFPTPQKGLTPIEKGLTPFKGRAPWARVGAFRRLALLALIVAQTIAAAMAMAEVLPYKGTRPLEIALLALFVVLFAWISAGFWTALAGFGLMLRGRDRFNINETPVAPLGGTRTAVVMPICNEDVGRVFAGLRATAESLVATGQARHFDFFVLSDTGNADLRVEETQAWLALRRALGDGVRVYYRWRQHHIKRKSGNVADFCRRWGRDYDHFVVLDADSVMTGDCLVRLAQLMEADPRAGIIQTAPRAFGRETLFARSLQFATAAYGPLFTAGLHFWQLGEAHYWGHNAILRTAPFMEHCALGRLPGQGALSGEVLSHDFVEAALMRRAGWGVWIAYDLPGSYEEVPPNLIDELARDRRWCLGNLMNLKLFRLEGLHPAHRATFMIAVMSYASAPLWFLSLVLGTALLAQFTLVAPEYFTRPFQLYPDWPQWHPEWALALFGSTALILFLPKLLSAGWMIARGRGAYGSAGQVAASVAIETVFSALFAPIRMLFHTQFVVTGIAGITLRWKSPSRADSETTWSRALARHGLHTLIGLAWIALVWYMDPAVLPWVLPVAGALGLSIPLSVYSSRVSLGRLFRRRGLFATPEELMPPRAVSRTLELAREAQPGPDLAHAVIDPAVNALACASATPRLHAHPAAVAQREALVEHALRSGIEALDARARSRLLNDPLALSALHLEAWTSSSAHASWRSMRH